MKYTLKTTGPAILVIALVMTFLAACNEAPTDSEITPTYGYELSGLFVRDINVDSIRAQAWLSRDGSPFDSADMAWGGDSLRWTEDRYSWSVSPYDAYGTGSYTLRIEDSGFFSGAYAGQLVRTPTIEITEPANQRLPGGGTVSLEWSATQGAQGYAMATVLKDSAYASIGYSEWGVSGATAGTIPREAFLGVGDEVVPGVYYVYVYAYSGAPDSAATQDLTPTPLPSRLPTNIAVGDLIGRFGMVSVSAYDSVEVMAK